MQTDVTSRADVEALRDAAIAAFGGFDVWINNAGRGITRSVLDLSDADVDEMMTVNVKTALYGMQIAAEHFLERGHGQIINVSSFLGRVPMATHRSAYNAAKAALNALTANLQGVELHARRIRISRVTLVMPGMVATEFALNARNGAAPGAAIVHRLARADRSNRLPTSSPMAVIEKPVAEVYTNPAVGRHGASVLCRCRRVRGSIRAGNPWSSHRLAGEIMVNRLA